MRFCDDYDSSSTYAQRSSSVDRRVNYCSRTASSESASMPTVIKSSWLSLVNATGLGDAIEQISRRLWFSLSPGKLTAFAGPSSHQPVFSLRLADGAVRSIDSSKNKYYCFIIECQEKTLTIGKSCILED